MKANEIGGIRRSGADDYAYAVKRTGEVQATAAHEPAKAERMPTQPQEKDTAVQVVAVDEEKMTDAVEELSKQMSKLGTRVSFFTDQDSGRLVIKVVENETNKVLKQIPAEEMMKMFSRMAELTGMLVDKRV